MRINFLNFIIFFSFLSCHSCAQSSTKIQSGLEVGEESPAFDPQHAWGPDKGSHACPMCKYGYHPGVVFFLNSDRDWKNSKKILQKLEEESVARKAKKFKAYLVYTNPSKLTAGEMEKKLARLGEELQIQWMALTYVPSVNDQASDMYKNKINPQSANTLIVYDKRKVKAKFIDFVADEQNFEALFVALKKAGN